MTDQKRLPKATVSVGILFYDHKILIGQRAYGGSCANLWEFPGGKIEPGETPQECLIREVQEEVGIPIAITKEFCRSSYSYPDRDIDFIFFLGEVLDITGLIHPVHQKLAWVSPQELSDYDFCPADEEILRELAKQF
jgi:8-oxo-dGTP diphosphatase